VLIESSPAGLREQRSDARAWLELCEAALLGSHRQSIPIRWRSDRPTVTRYGGAVDVKRAARSIRPGLDPVSDRCRARRSLDGRGDRGLGSDRHEESALDGRLPCACQARTIEGFTSISLEYFQRSPAGHGRMPGDGSMRGGEAH
jgi:hypothetical protein